MDERTELWAILTDTEPDALGLVTKAAELAAARKLTCRALVIAPELNSAGIRRLARAGADAATHLAAHPDDCGCETAARDYLAELAAERKPAAMLFLTSVFSGAVAPGAAALLRTGITADCTGLAWDADGRLLQSRPTFGGRLLAEIRTRTLPAIATVRRGVFPRRLRLKGADIPRERLELPAYTPACRLVGMEERGGPLDLRRAEILVAGGAGLGSVKNFERLYPLAEKLGGQVAASRGAVAAGFADYSRQVGQTGVTVRPRLYLAFGISGAVQHLSGMIDAECIVAVNPDRNAPIHTVSDYSVYADANAVIAALLTGDGKNDTGRNYHGVSALDL